MLSIISFCCSMASSGSSQMKVAFWAEEKVSYSRLTATQSSYLVTHQKPGPSVSSCHQTGALVRR